MPTKQMGTGIQPNAIAIRAVNNARIALGKPYIWGGTDYDKGVDCSGLCYTAYQMAGHPIPRTSYEQYGIGTDVPKGNEIPGDLVFSYSEADGPGHVVMAVGGGKCIAAPHTGTVVQYEALSNFDSVYVGTKRIVPAKGTGAYIGQTYDTGPGGGSSADDSSGWSDSLDTIKSGYDTLTSSSTWIRIGSVIGGLILVAVGIFILVRNSGMSVPIVPV